MGTEQGKLAMSGAARTELSERMHRLAEQRSDLPPDWLEKARAFDEAAAGFYAEPQTVTVMKFAACFARARRAWCEVTGEPLI